eukprot:TRINITY_DN14438_c0_g1_i4.p1 TRINITY_DN14438_c0_g1~~TRINITY_DN14438_c0_g1_i4.p1  ORF type:complete len:180 (-),score=56.68 TRINITY_DN14438_c0_g1_i4:372-911(-)
MALLTVDLVSPPVDLDAPLDDRDIDLVQQTFGYVAQLGTDTVGKVVFMKIFEKSPQALQLFTFKTETLDFCKLFRCGSPATVHSMKVVGTLGLAVDKLRALKDLVPILQKLGVKHVGYGVIPEHYDIVGQAIVDAMKVALGGLFTPAVSNAWLKVYKVVKTTMIEAAAAAKTPTPKKAG